MTTPQDDGGPAQTQPQEEYMAMMREANSPETKDRNLRDWFAGMALQGILAAQTEEGSFEYGPRNPPHDTWVPDTCYKLAEEMLAARKEGA